MPLGNDWVFTVNDHYKTANQILHQLAEVVSKVGNLMLGIGLDGNGVFPETVQQTPSRNWRMDAN